MINDAAETDLGVGLDAGSPPDAGMDGTTERDQGPSDVVDVRDAGGRDVPRDIDVVTSADFVVFVPVDPMGVPPPGSECTGDAGVRTGDLAVAPPRPILPQSVSRVTSQRPSFRWALPEGTTGARVEVCADRCCTRVIQTLEAEGTTVRPATALPPGVVYWRMFGRRAGVTGSRASYTWEFEVRRRDTPVDSSWGTIRDFTGDGYDDLLMVSGGYNPDGTRPLYVVEGGPTGPGAPRVLGALGADPYYGRPRIGDFDGDGRADFAYGRDDSGSQSMHVVVSGGGAVPRYQRLSYTTVSFAGVTEPMVVDWDGDGYSDLVTTVYFRDRSFEVAGSLLIVYRGSPSGLSLRPQEVTVFPNPIIRPWVEAGVELTDVDLDGLGDVLVSARNSRRLEYLNFILHRRDDGTTQAVVFPILPGPSELTSDVMYSMNVGDVDGDGLGDLALRLRDYGTFYLYRQVLGGPVSFSTVSESPPAGGYLDFGADIEGADLNGDGLSDVMVRSMTSAAEAWLDSGLPYNSGRMYVYFGGRDGLATAPIWFDRARPTDSMDNPQYFARRIASPGDLNADGIDDAAVVDHSYHTCCVVMGRPGLTGAHLGGCTPIPGAGGWVF